MSRAAPVSSSPSAARAAATRAFVTSAPARLDAPSTMTLYASTLADVAMFAANDVALDPAPADPWLAAANTLQP